MDIYHIHNLDFWELMIPEVLEEVSKFSAEIVQIVME